MAPQALPTAKHEPTVNDMMGAATTLPEALAVISPLFQDNASGLDPAAAVLGAWCAKRLYWDDMAALPGVDRAQVMKDPVAARGKANCITGTVVEIHVDRTVDPPAYTGAVISNGGDVVRFVAVGDTGTLVARSPARLCGVVTGTVSYANVSGGETHAIQVVGMFDLPSNRSRQRPQ